MKKLITLLLIVVLFLVACKAPNSNISTFNENLNGGSNMSENRSGNSTSSIEHQKTETAKEFDREMFSKMTNDDYAKKIRKVYDEQKFFKHGFLFRFYNPMQGYNPTMQLIVEELGFEIEYVRNVDKENYYCIFKTKENGLVYCFFREIYSELTLYNCAYLKEKLTKSNFDNLKVGNTIEDVIKIDTAYAAIYNYFVSVGSFPDESIHLLADGLMVIKYEESNQINIIKNIDYRKNFIYNRNGINYSYKILTEDYPKR